MHIHSNASLTPRGREVLVRRVLEDDLRVEEAAQASACSAAWPRVVALPAWPVRCGGWTAVPPAGA
jgi:hypothetical protein